MVSVSVTLMDRVGSVVAATIIGYRARGVDEVAVAFARDVVAVAGPVGPARTRSLLWVCSRLAAWGLAVGSEPSPALLHPSVIERFVTVGMAHSSATARRTARTNLRWVARRCGVAVDPQPAALPRGRAKAPYSLAEIEAFFALAAAQPTEARRQRLIGLLCLGLGAGIERGDLRAVTGGHVAQRRGAVVVRVEGRRARTVPVLARYRAPLLASAAFAGDGFVCGGATLSRKNLTADLVGKLAGGTDLPHLDVGRLRATWLAEQLGRLGVPQLLAAAGVRYSQRIWDLAAALDAGDEAALIERLG
jgi:integrase